uniref:Uncharacterized protein n=1 Tax=Stomoxys calcitrans TaxID=35570 RepID=A0A1I8QF16_STOCA
MEAPTTVDTVPITGGVAPTRGRGGGMRGSFERGRGRGMGRGQYSGMGAPGGFSSRGGYGPRGGGMGGAPMGYPSRGGFAPRGAPPMRGGPGVGGGPGGYMGRGGYQGAPRGGPPMRGTGRMPLYTQQLPLDAAEPKQHTGVDNNKTISPVQASANNQVVAIKEDNSAASTTDVAAVAQESADPNGTVVAAPTAPLVSKPPLIGTSPNYRGRGRGGPRGGGRGAYNPHNGSAGGMMSMHGGAPMQEHGMVRRGGPPRGRGSYQGTGMTRPPMHQHQHPSPHVPNTQVAPVSLKRGAPGGPPGPKRGRYETGPYSQRAPAPKYHQPPHMTQQTSSYGVTHQPAPPPPQSHHGYPPHVPAQTMDPYAQSYAAPQTQTAYNGYGQTATYAHTAPAHSTTHQANTAYTGSEYDQSQYQGYSSTYAQQDTRYQTYGQDYTQQYGAPAVDYNTSQADYSQHAQTYDERAYAGYEVTDKAVHFCTQSISIFVFLYYIYCKNLYFLLFDKINDVLFFFLLSCL